MGVPRAAWLATSIALSAASLLAQAPNLGPEFPVNTYTTGPQHEISAASRGDGTFVIVWTDGYPLSRGIEGEDGSTSGIFGQRFSSTGEKVGTDFLVNTFTTGAQAKPSIAMNADGTAVVVWRSPQDDLGAIFGAGVYGQRLDAAGAKVGGEFLVNTYTTSTQAGPAVAMSAAARSSSSGRATTGRIELRGLQSEVRRGGGEDRHGVPRQHVHDRRPVLAERGDGLRRETSSSSGSRAARTATAAACSDRSSTTPARRKGPEFAVNTYTTSNQQSPSVAMDRAGNFVVAFQSDGPDLDGFGIWARRYNSSAESLLGPEFQVNSYTTEAQTAPSVSVDRSGNITVVWASSFSQDGSKKGIFGQRLDRLGFLVGSEFQVNSYTSEDQDVPRAFDDGQGFAAAWTSDKQDGDGPGVYARRQRLHPRRPRRGHAGDRDHRLERRPRARRGRGRRAELEQRRHGLRRPGRHGSRHRRALRPELHTARQRGELRLDGAEHHRELQRRQLEPLLCRSDLRHASRRRTGTRRSRRTFRPAGRRRGSCTWATAFPTCRARSPSTGRSRPCCTTASRRAAPRRSIVPAARFPVIRWRSSSRRGSRAAGSSCRRPGSSEDSRTTAVAGGVSRFSDIAPTDPACKHVHYLGAQNVTSDARRRPTARTRP